MKGRANPDRFPVFQQRGPAGATRPGREMQRIYLLSPVKALTTRSRPILKSRARNRSRWRVPNVDQVMAEERAAAFGRRSIKASAKLEGLKLVVSMMDLTTLEGSDTPGKIAFLCRKAMQPLDPHYQVPNCAAVCVYPNLIRIARKFLEHSSVKVASVATAFPAGLMPAKLKRREVRGAVRDPRRAVGRGALPGKRAALHI